jgi:predicted AAA+ superfamily ATPase
MIDNRTFTIVNQLIHDASEKRKRNIIDLISKEISTKPPIKILRGLRGIGKTTALLQIIKTCQEKSFYFSADWPQVRRTTLYEYTVGLIEDGYKMLFIDEIHTYPGWESETKAIVDQFPGIKLFVTGSAPVVFRGDRREKIYEWGPMSFSEYLHLKHDVKIEIESEEVWKSPGKSTTLISRYYPDIEGWFKEYLKIGGFPFSLEYSYQDTVDTIFTVIKQSIEKDAVTILKLSPQKIMAMEKLLYFVATSSPGEMSINSLSRNLGISKIIVDEIIGALEQMKLLRALKPDASGAKLIRGEPKILFSHPNLRAAICDKLGVTPDIGSTREELALFGLEQRGYKVYTIKGFKKNPDYVIKKNNISTVIEIGGEGKSSAQLKDFPDSLLVKGNQLMTLLLE